MDRILSKIKKYPFQTGIAIGVLACLIFFGLIGLFTPKVTDLNAVDAVIREDYLRMAVADYDRTGDDDVAVWRVKNFGKGLDETMQLMKRDPATSPDSLIDFAQTVGKETDLLLPKNEPKTVEKNISEPGTVKKGLSPFSIALLIILGVLILLSGGYYLWSEAKNRKQQSRRTAARPMEPMNVVDPDDMDDIADDFSEFDREMSFPDAGQNRPKMRKHIPADPVQLDFSDVSDDGTVSPKNETVLTIPDHFVPEPEEKAAEAVQPVQEEESDDSDDREIEDRIEDIISEPVREEEPAPVQAEEDEEEPPFDLSAALSEEPEAESAESTPEAADADDDEIKPIPWVVVQEEPAETPAEEVPEKAVPEKSVPEVTEEVPEQEDDLLVHYEATYQLGDDYFDETFSIDENEVFLGECGIGIGETLNNTEPKAVTAFEIWLFDRNDNNTPTHYLLSDFAMTNDGIVDRMKQKGNYDRIKKGCRIEFTTESLKMLLTVKALEYGSDPEIPERNSYFNAVTFDIKVRRNEENS